MPIPDPAWGADEWLLFLRDNLKKSVFNDVVPLLQTPGALFSPIRLSLCYVDYLGALREGPLPGEKNIATSAKAIKFLEEVFGRVAPEYKTHGRVLYTAYRHGLVHQFAPKILQRADGRTLSWLVYHGDRRSTPFRHLGVNVDVAGTADSMHVSVNCIVQDLIEAIDVFASEIRAEQVAGLADVVGRMRAAASVLAQAHKDAFCW